jgi:hypothetical protein
VVTQGNRCWTGAGLLAAFVVGCGRPVPQPAPVQPAIDAAPASSPLTDAGPPTDAKGLAAFGDAIPFGIRRDEPFAEVKLFSHVTLHFQRMIALQEKKLHAELKLTEAQVGKFIAHGEDVKGLQAELQNMRPEDRETKMLKEFVPKAERYKALVEQELTSEQRFLVLQKVAQKQRGAIVLLLPGIPEHLEMTDHQLTAVYQIVDENRKSVNWDEVKGNLLEMSKLMRRASAARSEAENQLTESQKKRWQTLLGR